MEDLSLKDSQQRLSMRRTSPLRRSRSPRLPTPETSRGSKESLDRLLVPDDAVSSVSTSGPMPGAREGTSTSTAILPSRGNAHFNVSRRHPVPHSPPYGASDAKPVSLPPLKTLLGDHVSSPPQTPTMLDPSSQPSPQEPSLTSMTYKPPSLYPNKKQRTEGPTEPHPPFSASSSLSSPETASTVLKPYHPAIILRSDSPGPGVTPNDGRRYSVQPVYSSERHPGVPSGASRGFPGSHTRSVTADRSYYTRDHTPVSHHYDRSVLPSLPSLPRRQDSDARMMPDRYFDRQSAGRRSSADVYNSGSARSSRQHYPMTTYQGQDHYVHGSRREDFAFHNGQTRPERPEHYGTQDGPSHGPYDSARSSFFMPSQYDYQHGKARKRSNLPKASTEIMKTWFDQNITNPYPSEEQKAVFSSATGISMTQVSNWFINHRRRCPELREKRERNRCNGGDGDL